MKTRRMYRVFVFQCAVLPRMEKISNSKVIWLIINTFAGLNGKTRVPLTR